MLNKKKLTIIAVIAVVLIGALTAGILAAVNTARTRTTPAAVSASPTAAPGADGFTAELESTAITAAATAAVFSGSDTRTQRVRSYVGAMFTQELAENFEPVWFDVFSDPIVGKVQIEATGETLISAVINVKGSVLVQDVTVSGKPGHRVYTVAVAVDCQPQWTTNTGNPRMPTAFTATWHIVLDEATGMVTGIEQPDPADIPVHPES